MTVPSHLKLPDSQAVHFRNRFVTLRVVSIFSRCVWKSRYLFFLPPTPETEREVHMPQTAHPENKIITDCLNLLMENLEKC